MTCNGTTTTAPSTSRINFTEPSGNYTYAVAPVSGFYTLHSSGYILVQAHNASQGIMFYPYTYILTFAETGLPTNSSWVVFLGTDYNYGTTANISFVEPNGSYSYSISQGGPFVWTPTSGTVNVTGSNVTVDVQFVPNGISLYSVQFLESGLSSVPWEVFLGGAVGGSSSSSITLNVPNGTYAFVAYTTYWAYGSNWDSSDGTGNVTVSGSNVSILVHFHRAPYTVAFVESGLPSPGIFEAAVDGLGRAGAGTTSFAEASGSFPYQVFPAYGLFPWPENGTVAVNGGDVTINVDFGPLRSAVVFTESGLPAATNWSVDVNGTTRSTIATSLTIWLPNGTYAYSVPTIANFAQAGSGTFSVTGSPVSLLVNFTRNTFLLTFQESGLPAGSEWGVVIGAETESGASSNLSFLLPDGVYGFLVLGIPGYVDAAATPAVLSGAPATVSVTFSLQAYPIVFVQLGLPAGSNWSVTVANLSLNINRTESSIGDSITFFLPNGTYTVRFDLPSGYQLNSTESEFTVAGGGDHDVPISGTSPGATRPPLRASPAPPAAQAPPVGLILEYGLGLAAVAALGIVVGRRTRPPGNAGASAARSAKTPEFEVGRRNGTSTPGERSPP